MSAVIGSNEAVWTVGYVFGQVQGEAQLIPFAEAQDFQLKDSIATTQAMGASSLGAVAVGIKSRTVTGNCKWLRLRLNAFRMARGGTLTYSSTTKLTTYAAGILDEPKPFDLQFSTPTSSLLTADTELLVHTCLAPELTQPLAQRDFGMPDFTFDCFGNGTNFYEFLRPGDQTAS